MRLDELVDLNDVLKSSQYIKLLRHLKTSSKEDINIQRIKNQVIQSWQKGMKSRKHYSGLLNQLHINLTDIIK
jgi:hypothetical protein